MAYLKIIIPRALVPWVAYSVLSLIYFAHTLDQDFETAEEAEHIVWQGLGVVILIIVLY